MSAKSTKIPFLYLEILSFALFLLLALRCGKSPSETDLPTVTVAALPKGGTNLTEAQSLTFLVTSTPAADVTEDEAVVSLAVYYTLDNSDPTVDSTKVEIPTTAPTVENGAKVYTSETSLTVTTNKILKYMAVLTLDHKSSTKNSIGQAKETSENVSVQSSVNSETYAFASGVVIATPTPTPSLSTGTPSKASLSVTSGTPTSLSCFSLTATAKDSSGASIISNVSMSITLSTTTGSGTFYSNSSCTTSTTTATISANSSTTKVYYKDNTAESVALVATYNGTAGTALSLTLPGPAIAAFAFATTSHASCAPVSFYFKDSSSSAMVESLTQATTVTLTQTTGTNGTFYTSSDCSTGSLTTSGVSTLTVPANSSGLTLYFSNSGSATYTFSGSWVCGSTSNSGYTNSFFL